MLQQYVQSVIIFCIFLSEINAWQPAERKEERMPLELRDVNEGVAHYQDRAFSGPEGLLNGSYWIFSNKHFLYKASVVPILIQDEIIIELFDTANYDAVTPELRKLSYNHIGDIDVAGDVIYGGIEGDHGTGILAAWSVKDLSMIRYTVTEQNGMPWVAVHNKRLYSAVWNDCCQLQVYNLDTFAFVESLTITPGLPGEIQGGAFYRGDLYICTNAQDGIWKIDLTKKTSEFVLSDAYDNHEYEMEGLDFWDLSRMKLGVMHIFGNFMQVREKAVRNYDP